MAKLLSIVVLAGFPLLATAQLQVPMEYVDEVGPVGWQDQRTSVDLGLATVYHECVECEANTASDQLRFEGKMTQASCGGCGFREWVVSAALKSGRLILTRMVAGTC
jgi:uncharacterized membrane protein